MVSEAKISSVSCRVGLKLPTVEVRYNNLHVEAECEVVNGKPLPTIWNSLQSMFFVSGYCSLKIKLEGSLHFLHFIA